MKTLAYKFALLPPLDWGDDCEAQLRKATTLWNALVETERKRGEAINAVVDPHPDVAAALATLHELRAEFAGPATRRKAIRKKARKAVPTLAEDAWLDDIKKRWKATGSVYWTARRAAMAENAEEIKAQNDLYFERVKAVSQNASADGLWHGHKGAITDSFADGVGKSRSAGMTLNLMGDHLISPRAQMQFKRFVGEGRFRVQIKDGGMPVQSLFDGSHSEVKIIDLGIKSPCRCRVRSDGVKIVCTPCKRRYHLVMCAYTNGKMGIKHQKRYVRFPIIMHRDLPLPHDDRGRVSVQMITVTRRRIADRFAWDAVFNLRIADEPQQARPVSIAAVNFGWRRTEDGLRVATIVRDGQVNSVMLPSPIEAGQRAGERKFGLMQEDINGMESWLGQLSLEFAPQGLLDVVAKIKAAKKVRGGHFEWLRETWERDCGKWRPVDLEELQSFGKRWRRYKRDDAAGREWVRNAKLYHYRAEIRRLLAGCTHIVVNAHDMSETAEREDNELWQAARHNRVLAAPSIFRGTLVEWAAKHGVNISVDETAHDACACHGMPFGAINRAALRWSCPVTHIGLDQDEDFCHAMLNRLGDPEKTVAARDGEAAEKKGRFRPNRKCNRNDVPLAAE